MTYHIHDAAPDSPRYVTATPIDHSVIDMDEAWGERAAAEVNLASDHESYSRLYAACAWKPEGML